jgi:hypothetical protein
VAKITTRKTEADKRSIEISKQLVALLEKSTGQKLQSLVTFDPAETQEDLDFLISAVDVVISTAISTAIQLRDALSESAVDNINLSIEVFQQQTKLDQLTNVNYDEALEHATIDLMDTIVSSGIANISDEGDVVFDTRSVVTKNDLKPALRVAINRWVEQKLQ